MPLPRRLTKQQAVVAATLAVASRAVSAQELHERLVAERGRIGLATIYRALEAQVAEGTAGRVERAGHVTASVACVPEHHHHLVCTSCQRVEDLSEVAFAPLIRAVRRRHGFQVDHAALDLYGICQTCRDAHPAERTRSA